MPAGAGAAAFSAPAIRVREGSRVDRGLTIFVSEYEGHVMGDWSSLAVYVPLVILLISLLVSLGTFWLAYLHRGRLRMTKPVVVFFGFDMESRPVPKVFLRMLLYSTAARGHVVEAMHVRLRHGEDESTFSFWGCGETTNLIAGAGLHVSKVGFAANHHFLRPFMNARIGFLRDAMRSIS